MVLSDRISSSLAVFLNGYEHIEVLLNPCKINQNKQTKQIIYVQNKRTKTKLKKNKV